MHLQGPNEDGAMAETGEDRSVPDSEGPQEDMVQGRVVQSTVGESEQEPLSAFDEHVPGETCFSGLCILAMMVLTCASC